MSQFKSPFNQPLQQPPALQPQTPIKRPVAKQSLLPIWVTFAVIVLLGTAVILIPTIFHLVSSSNTTTSGSTATWTTTHTFTGNGIKQTEAFTVPDDWMILWSCTGVSIGSTSADGALVIYVYNASGALADVAVDATCKAGQTTTDSTEEHQGGTIYLKMDSTTNWVVQVQELE